MPIHHCRTWGSPISRIGKTVMSLPVSKSTVNTAVVLESVVLAVLVSIVVRETMSRAMVMMMRSRRRRRKRMVMMGIQGSVCWSCREVHDSRPFHDRRCLVQFSYISSLNEASMTIGRIPVFHRIHTWARARVGGHCPTASDKGGFLPPLACWLHAVAGKPAAAAAAAGIPAAAATESDNPSRRSWVGSQAPRPSTTPNTDSSRFLIVVP